MGFDLADLRLFTTIVNARSLSGAARELHITQPSVSERLGRMERRVGQPLLVRSSRGVTLTPAGHRLFPHAQRCLALADRALALAKAEDTEAAVHITTYASYAPLAVPFVIETLRGLRCSISVDDQHSEDAVHRVAVGSTDVAFTLAVPHAHEVQLHEFLRDEVIAVCRPDHLLANRPCDLRRLSAHPVVFNNWGSGAEAFAERLLDHPTKAHEVYKVSPAETVAEMARAGLAVGLVMRSTVQRDLASRTLIQLDIKDLPEWSIDIMLAHRRDRQDDPPIAALIDRLKR